jgi:chromosome segregation ATPase
VAKVDQHESEHARRLKETLNQLQKIFPGVKGRVVDLCRPVQRKYETAVATVLGRNLESVVVDEERTAVECIEVSNKFSYSRRVYAYYTSTFAPNERELHHSFLSTRYVSHQ